MVEQIRKAWCIRYTVAHNIDVPSKYANMRRVIGV